MSPSCSIAECGETYVQIGWIGMYPKPDVRACNFDVELLSLYTCGDLDVNVHLAQSLVPLVHCLSSANELELIGWS